MPKILIVHLTDMHLDVGDNGVSKRSEQIAAAMQTHFPAASMILLALTGDITQSGQADQFLVAERFVSDLVASIRDRSGMDAVVLAVPGNHDANFGDTTVPVRTALLKQLQTDGVEKIDPEVLGHCVRVFENFEAFRGRVETLHAERRSAVWRTALVNHGEVCVEVHCVNNAWSCEKSTPMGFLGFPTSLHGECSKSSGAMRVLLMHHPAHWLATRQYRDFRKLTRACAEICFSGHEHTHAAGANTDQETGHTIYIEGPVLQEHKDYASSAFGIATIDIAARYVETVSYEWDGSAYIAKRQPFLQSLPAITPATQLTPQWADFLSDLGANLAHGAKEKIELADLYVYPELERDDASTDQPALGSLTFSARELAHTTECVLVKGPQGSGKTAMLKQLYSDLLSQQKVPVYINGIRLKNSSAKEIEKLIQTCIHEQYAGADALQAEQSHPKNRVLLVDNLDRYSFPARYLSQVLAHFNLQFSRVVATVDSSFDLQEIFLGEDQPALQGFEQMRLPETGFSQRYELVTKWFELSQSSPLLDQQIEMADRVISRVLGRGLVPSHPIYVLILLQGIEAGRVGELENSALGHYYEYMILEALNPKIRPEHLHEILNYCAQFAWFLRSRRKERVSDSEMRDFHRSFETLFDLEINFAERRLTLIEANLFLEVNEELGFRYPYTYFFFLGRYVSRYLGNQEVQAFVAACCKNLHVRENANAMLFLVHHSSDRIVLDSLKSAVDKQFANIPPLELQADARMLDELVEAAPVLVLNDSQRRRERTAAMLQEHRINQHLDGAGNEISTTDGDSEAQVRALETLAAINGLFKGVEILGAALKANFGAIEADTKAQMIDSLFRGGLRGLRFFLEVFSQVPPSVLTELGALLDASDSETPEDREHTIKVRLFHIVSRFSFYFIQRIGSSATSKSMLPAISRYVKEHDTVANQLVAMAGRLETPGRIPFKELQALNERVSRTIFAQSVLRLVVISRIYMYKTDEAEKQQVCQELGIRVATQHAIDYKTRNLKKLAAGD
ncbi:metallophosphoesterase [Casimicrobium huifangae]|uniref:STAND family AAA ATPase n=1 Tax=Casimicrobium huifangae TaxID=2591109 RepID=UPI0012EBB1AB|nr:metallophosphoesterase [Casimicrobium huifangae]